MKYRNRKRVLSLLPVAMAVLCLCGVPGNLAYAQQAPEGATAEDAFSLLFERNIFDPERRPVLDDTPAYTPEETFEEERDPVDYLHLAGVLITDETAIAFLEGSQASYTTALFLDEYVEDLMLVDVDTEGATFYSGGDEITLAVGETLERGEEGLWRPSTATPHFSAPDAAAPEAASGDENTDGPEDDAAESLLERLKKRREQELGNE